MPKVALVKLLKHKSKFQRQDTIDEEEKTLDPEEDEENLKDTGFSVYSNPKFLYLIGKICVRSTSFIDLALQSFHDYLLIITYYKDYIEEDEYQRIRCKTLIWIATLLEQVGELE